MNRSYSEGVFYTQAIMSEIICRIMYIVEQNGNQAASGQRRAKEEKEWHGERRARDPTLYARDTSAYANSSLDNFLHHGEDFSRWWANADWMAMDISLLLDLLMRRGMWAGISAREKKYSSAVMITPRNYNCADGSFNFQIVCWRSVAKPQRWVYDNPFFVPGGGRALIMSCWKWQWKTVILYWQRYHPVVDDTSFPILFFFPKTTYTSAHSSNCFLR